MSILNNLKENIKTIKANKAYLTFKRNLKLGLSNGTIKKFDDEFYSQFEGQYFNGLPVYYYLHRMNMGKCYDCSAILGLALGKGTKICRGNLQKMAIADKQNSFGHGWVEKDGLVYDTTWQIICDKDIYYELMGVKNPSVTDSSKFFHDCKDISNWEIHDKSYYENNYTPFASLLIFQVREIEKLVLEKPTETKEEALKYNTFSLYDSSEKSKNFARKVLNDLPDTSKAPTFRDFIHL